MPKRSRSGEVSRPARVVAPDQRERRQVELDRARAGTLADHDVELKVLHRRIEDLLDDRAQPMDLVDEQHVVRLQVRQQRRQVAGALDHRSGGLSQIHAQLVRDDVRERGLAEARRAEDQHVVERLAPVARGLDEDLHLRLDRRLADVVGELLRAHGAIERCLVALRACRYDAVLLDHFDCRRLQRLADQFFSRLHRSVDRLQQARHFGRLVAERDQRAERLRLWTDRGLRGSAAGRDHDARARRIPSPDRAFRRPGARRSCGRRPECAPACRRPAPRCT